MIAPEDMRGRYMGVFGLTWASAMTVGPALGMSLFSVHAPALWTCCVALGLAGAVLALGVEREGN